MCNNFNPLLDDIDELPDYCYESGQWSLLIEYFDDAVSVIGCARNILKPLKKDLNFPDWLHQDARKIFYGTTAIQQHSWGDDASVARSVLRLTWRDDKKGGNRLRDEYIYALMAIAGAIDATRALRAIPDAVADEVGAAGLDIYSPDIIAKAKAERAAWDPDVFNFSMSYLSDAKKWLAMAERPKWAEREIDRIVDNAEKEVERIKIGVKDGPSRGGSYPKSSKGIRLFAKQLIEDYPKKSAKNLFDIAVRRCGENSCLFQGFCIKLTKEDRLVSYVGDKEDGRGVSLSAWSSIIYRIKKIHK